MLIDGAGPHPLINEVASMNNCEVAAGLIRALRRAPRAGPSPHQRFSCHEDDLIRFPDGEWPTPRSTVEGKQERRMTEYQL